MLCGQGNPDERIFSQPFWLFWVSWAIVGRLQGFGHFILEHNKEGVFWDVNSTFLHYKVREGEMKGNGR